jgi:hypothetical protein
MSSNDINVETEVKRHRGPLVGISIALLFAAALFAGLVIWTAYQSDNPTAESPAEVVSD